MSKKQLRVGNGNEPPPKAPVKKAAKKPAKKGK